MQCHMHKDGVQCSRSAVYMVYQGSQNQHGYFTRWKTYMCSNHVECYNRDHYKLAPLNNMEVKANG